MSSPSFSCLRQELARRAAAVAAAKTGPGPRSREASKPFDFVLRVAGPDNAGTQVVEEIPAALTSPKSRMEVEVGLVSSPSFPSPEPPTTGQPKPPLQMSPPPTQPFFAELPGTEGLARVVPASHARAFAEGSWSWNDGASNDAARKGIAGAF